MLLAVTGASGFVGAHVVRALIDHGHDVRLLVRDEGRVRRAMEDLDLEVPALVVGDVLDVATVDALVDGADVLVHAAAIVSLDARRSQEMCESNRTATTLVIDRALKREVRRIVHVSSTSALFRPGVGPLTSDLEVAETHDAYARSKAECDRIARRFQDDGAPVLITYPSGILGPAAGPSLGATTEGVARFVASGCLPTRHAALSIIDARDLAEIHACLVDLDDPPARVMCGGTLVNMPELGQILRALTGRRFPMLPVPPPLLRSIGRALDLVSKVVPLSLPITAESMALVTRWQGTEDNRLGVSLRPVEDTLTEALRAADAAGLLKPHHLGTMHR